VADLDVARTLIRTISSWISIVPIVSGLWLWNKLSAAFRFIWLYCLLSLIVEQLLHYFAKNGINNMPFFHFFPVIEFALFVLFFKNELKGIVNTKFYYLLPLLFMLITIINIIFFQSLFELNSNTTSIESVVLVFLSLYAFYILVKNMSLTNHLFARLFWVSSGILIYFSGLLLFFILNNFFAENIFRLYTIGWIYHAFLNINLYVFLSIGLWKQQKI